MPAELPETLDEALLEEARAVATRIRAQGEQAERLRHLADRIDDQSARDRALLEDLESALGTASQLRIDELDGRLRGQRLEEVAISLLSARLGADEEIHYRQWLGMLEEEGHRVAGKNPAATFLAQINRSDRIESVAPRSGRYRLRAVA